MVPIKFFLLKKFSERGVRGVFGCRGFFLPCERLKQVLKFFQELGAKDLGTYH